MTPKDVVKMAKERGAKIVDLRFIDLPGLWQHFSIPMSELSEGIFEDGLGFDGSSIRGFQTIDESDMLLMPDPSTAQMDPYTAVPTLVLICNVKDPVTGKAYTRDPRYVAQKAEAYGFEGVRVDGMDVLAVYQATTRAVAKARAGGGPTLIEAVCYRFGPHATADDARLYRDEAEEAEWRGRDPIDRLRRLMLDEGIADEDTFKAIDKEIRAIVNEAASFAQDSPEPDPKELYTDVYLPA